MSTATKYIKKSFQKSFQKVEDENYNHKKIYTERLIQFRHLKDAVTKIPKPTNIPRARSLGYKAKQGFITCLVRVRKGSGLVRRPNRGRRPKRMGVNKITRRISIQRMAENKADNKYPNLQVLNSYLIGEDGQKKYYEVILVDPDHPSIINDMDINWVCSENHKGRARRGKTSAGRKNRGIKRGLSRSKNRPSLRANNRKAN